MVAFRGEAVHLSCVFLQANCRRVAPRLGVVLRSNSTTTDRKSDVI
jgi:hypothetical protein